MKNLIQKIKGINTPKPNKKIKTYKHIDYGVLNEEVEYVRRYSEIEDELQIKRDKKED